MKKIYTQPRTETVATTPQQILCASGIKAKINGYSTGGGFTQSVIIGVICSSLLFLGTACSTTNNPDQPKQQAELKPRTLVVQTSPQPSPNKERGIQRLPQATITENGGALDAIWSAGDEISFRNISHATYTPSGPTDGAQLDGVLLADRAASIASFTSNHKVWCELGDQILLVYPKATAPAISVEGNPLRATYFISLANQNGTLEQIASTYHHSYGIATITEVTPTVANAELAEMQNLLTVCKFSFVDEEYPGTLLPITSLSISYNGGDYPNTYPGTARVTVTQGTSSTATVTPDKKSTSAEGNPLTVSPDGNPEVVYVALFPEADETTYSFTVTSGEDTYTGTATARLNAGEFVVAELKLTKKVNP